MVNASCWLLRSTMLPRTAFETSVTLSCPAAWARSFGALVTCRANNWAAATSISTKMTALPARCRKTKDAPRVPTSTTCRVRRSRAEWPSAASDRAAAPDFWPYGIPFVPAHLGLCAFPASEAGSVAGRPWLPAVYPDHASAAAVVSGRCRRGSSAAPGVAATGGASAGATWGPGSPGSTGTPAGRLGAAGCTGTETSDGNGAAGTERGRPPTGIGTSAGTGAVAGPPGAGSPGIGRPGAVSPGMTSRARSAPVSASPARSAPARRKS